MDKTSLHTSSGTLFVRDSLTQSGCPRHVGRNYVPLFRVTQSNVELRNYVPLFGVTQSNIDLRNYVISRQIVILKILWYYWIAIEHTYNSHPSIHPSLPQFPPLPCPLPPSPPPALPSPGKDTRKKVPTAFIVSSERQSQRYTISNVESQVFTLTCLVTACSLSGDRTPTGGVPRGKRQWPVLTTINMSRLC